MTELFDFSAFPQLETERLILREITSDDRDALFAVYGDEEAMRYYDIDAMTDPAQVMQIIDWTARIFRDKKGLRWAITLKAGQGTAIGTCGYNVWHQPDANGNPGFHGVKATIGYDLARDYWGQGIMTEALTAMLRFGFAGMALHRVEAEVVPGNVGSERLLAKLGFQLEGTLRDYAYARGQYQTLRMFSLLRRESDLA